MATLRTAGWLAALAGLLACGAACSRRGTSAEVVPSSSAVDPRDAAAAAPWKVVRVDRATVAVFAAQTGILVGLMAPRSPPSGRAAFRVAPSSAG